MSSPRGAVLVVEDDPAQRAALAGALRRAGFTVLEPARGEEAPRLAAGPARPLVQEVGPAEPVIPARAAPRSRQAGGSPRAGEARLRALLENGFDASLLLGPDGAVYYASPSVTDVLGYAPEELVGRNASEFLHPDDQGGHREWFARLLASPGGRTTAADRYRHEDGRWRWLEARGRNLLDDPAVRGVVVTCRDVTDRRRLEEQLLQAQKMEAVGRLAGGIAHDFNNLLTVITGYADLLTQSLPAEGPLREQASEVRRAGERAALLTGQLLAFCRQEAPAPTLLDLNAVVRTVERMLRRVIGADVELVADLDPAPVRTRADAGQLEQVLLNLAVNARDAMPAGGRLTIATRAAGPEVLLRVADTGLGMSAEVRARACEPFFTTKEAGKGTGMGLATVCGIVRQAGGRVEVESEPGRGATFTVYLPLAAGRDEPAPPPPRPAAAPRGRETVLLVEDEGAVRALGRQALQGSGYTVLEATHGGEALRLCERHRGRIDLLVTDVVMPEVGGRQLAARLAALRPDMRVLFVSGYGEEAVLRPGTPGAGAPFLQKPFTPLDLARKVRAVLDAPAPPAR